MLPRRLDQEQDCEKKLGVCRESDEGGDCCE